VIETARRGPRPEPEPGSVANALYLVWGAIGLSILAEFALLLYLQRAGQVPIEDQGGPWPTGTHLTLVLALAAGALLFLRLLRARLRDPVALRRSVRPGVVTRSGGSAPLPESSPGAALVSAPSAARAVATRFVGLSILQWALAEALALAGLTVAFLLQPAPRAALILYFTLALALWVWYRPDLPALSEALRGAGRSV
jgi:hypothetical protein